MSYWNYRVFKNTAEDGEVYFEIHEVYYNKSHEIVSVSKSAICPQGSSKEELISDLSLMNLAFEKPSLEFDKIEYGDSDY